MNLLNQYNGGCAQNQCSTHLSEKLTEFAAAILFQIKTSLTSLPPGRLVAIRLRRRSTLAGRATWRILASLPCLPGGAHRHLDTIGHAILPSDHATMLSAGREYLRCDDLLEGKHHEWRYNA
jgi:hypothetical protein